MQIMEEESPSPLKIMDEEAPSPVLTTVEGLSSKIVHEVTWWEKVKHVIGPGFVISIAYLDPGNLQADIKAGSTSAYSLMWTIMWATILSLYIQMLCVRLAIYKQTDLAKALGEIFPKRLRIVCWILAEYLTIITDIPEVVGMGVAFNVFCGWPYYAGVCLSFLSTMIFLVAQTFAVKSIEVIAAVFMALLCVAMFVEWGYMGTDTPEFFRGFLFGFVDIDRSHTFDVLAIIGSVVMPHNLYLHSGCLRSRPSISNGVSQKEVAWLNNMEMIFPVLFSIFANVAVIAIAAVAIYGTDNADDAGIANFSSYIDNMKYGSSLWGLALLFSAQSSCVTTTYTGQLIMEGYMKWEIPISVRAALTRSITIIPCIIVAIVADEKEINFVVNFVNSSLAILLPFALTPLVKLVSSPTYMGKTGAPSLWHSRMMRFVAALVYVVNAVVLIFPGAGFLGDFVLESTGVRKGIYIVICIFVEVVYLLWNLWVVYTPLVPPSLVKESELHNY